MFQMTIRNNVLNDGTDHTGLEVIERTALQQPIGKVREREQGEENVEQRPGAGSIPTIRESE